MSGDRHSVEGTRSLILRRPDTLTEVISRYIHDAIVRGEFAPGARLPETALANELDASRGTVREALRTLADRGLVDVIPHRGVFVSQLSVRATWEITSMRALLEPYAAQLALEASGSDPAFQDEVREAFDQLRRATTAGDPLTVADADVGFHRAVYSRCGHQMLLGQLEKLEALSRRLVLTNQLYAADAPTLIGQHAPIAAAVEAQDSARLDAEVRAHVIQAGELLLSRMATAERRSPGSESDGRHLGSWPVAPSGR